MYFKKYNLEVPNKPFLLRMHSIVNQIYKLLPIRQEGEDWRLPLETINEELAGMLILLPDEESLFALVCKLQGLLSLDKQEDFLQYRRTIFECLNLLDKLVKRHES